jgi:hypothetical protein
MTTITGHRLQGVVDQNGNLLLADLPPGQQVEVLVLPATNEASKTVPAWQSLLGTIKRDDDPFGPAVPPDDWEATR